MLAMSTNGTGVAANLSRICSPTRRYSMHKKHLALGSMVVAGAMILSGCASGSTDTSKSTGVNKNVDGKGKTLTLWHYESDTSAMGIAWNQAIKTFEKETGAKVKFEPKSFEQIRSTASQVLNSDAAPDILEYNKGNATAGLLSSQGLLVNLDSAVTTYGWDKKLAPSLQTTAKYDDKGIMGSGHWSGVPNYGEYVEVFYNKACSRNRTSRSRPRRMSSSLRCRSSRTPASHLLPSPQPSTRSASSGISSHCPRPTAPSSTTTSSTRAR